MHDNLKSVAVMKQNVAMGYLRAFLTVLVIAHHAMLAYHPYAPPPPASLSAEPMVWLAFPVVDSHRAPGVELLVGFNDAFFMSLMFLVSGLFVLPSLQRKGAGTFLRDRVRRLGIPFVVASALLAPLAYFPSYLQSGGAPSLLGGFWQTWRSLPYWPSGPAWFLWVLLVFGAVAAALTRVAPGWGDALGRLAERFQRPSAFFGCLVAASAVAYLPLAIGLDPFRWWSWGPFSVQASRSLHYAVYFFAGAALGAHGIQRGLLAEGGTLARHWPRWVAASLGAFLSAVAVFLVALSRGAGWWAAADATFVLSCAASSFAFLALFVRFVRQGRVADSLSANAYGMYITHYALVSWLQYALLGAALPGAAKATLVFLGAVALSWGLTAALGRIPAVARVLYSIAPGPLAGEVGAVSR
jgi:peptidoglycan/LPS O-acetylase OafA/YrhL